MTGVDGVCLVTVQVDSNKCTFCMDCVQSCPTGALHFDGDVVVFMHKPYECSYCEVCMDVCPEECITITGGRGNE